MYDELITRAEADTLFRCLLAIGLIAAPLAALLARRRRADGLLWGLAAGGPLVLMGVLWRVYNAITDRLGLDTVRNLAVNLALFVTVGLVCGVVGAWVLRRRGGGGPAASAAAPPQGGPPPGDDGGALVGAGVRGPSPRRSSGAARTFEESDAPPRNP